MSRTEGFIYPIIGLLKGKWGILKKNYLLVGLIIFGVNSVLIGPEYVALMALINSQDGSLNKTTPEFSSSNHKITFEKGYFKVNNQTRILQVQFLSSNEISPRINKIGFAQGQNNVVREVIYPNLWDGIDLLFENNGQGLLTNTYYLDAHANPDQIKLHFNAPLNINQNGDIEIFLDDGVMTFSAPIAYQQPDKNKEYIDINYEQIDNSSVGFQIGSYDPNLSLTIDPTLIWNQFYDSATNDFGYAIARDKDNNTYFLGTSQSSWGSPISPHSGKEDVFIAKINHQKELEWNTFLGSTTTDIGYDITINNDGDLIVVGTSSASWGEPIKPFSGDKDIFLAYFDKNGHSIWNTFLGSDGEEIGNAIDVDDQGNIYLTGYSDKSWGKPIQTGYESSIVAKVNPNGILEWHTFLGSTDNKAKGKDIKIGNDGTVYITGLSKRSWGNPIHDFQGGGDGFVAKLTSDGLLVWNTFIGSISYDIGTSITTDNENSIFVTGNSNRSWGQPLEDHKGKKDVFLAKLKGNGEISWNTFLGSKYTDISKRVEVDNKGDIYITGFSHESWGLPINDYQGGGDGFVAKVSPLGMLDWVTFLGSDEYDVSEDLTLDETGHAFIIGSSKDNWGNPDNLHQGKGKSKVFVAELDLKGELIWNTFIGSNDFEDLTGIDIDQSGNYFLVGYSSGHWGDPIHDFTGETDVFVAKVDQDGALIWNTFLGSIDLDFGHDIEVDSKGNIYIIGRSDHSWGSPINPHSGLSEAFVAKINDQGKLLWNTFLGSESFDRGVALSVHHGEVFIIGSSDQQWGTPIYSHSGGYDAFIAKLSQDGSLAWHTFLGSDQSDFGYDLDVSESGDVFLCGTSSDSWGDPVSTYEKGMSDAFVAKLNAGGGRIWNTFLGSWKSDGCNALQLGNEGNVFVVGTSSASWGNPQNLHQGLEDAFVSELNTKGDLQWNTFLGSNDVDYGLALDIDEVGNVYITGVSDGNWGVPIRPHSGGNHEYLVMLDKNGKRIWNTFIDSHGFDGSHVIKLTNDKSILIGGSSNSYWGNIPHNLVGKVSYLAKFILSPEIKMVGYQDITTGTLYTNMQNNSINFGNIPVGYGESTINIGLMNIGSKELNLTGSPLIQIKGIHASDFSVTILPDSSISYPSGETKLTITFKPSQKGFESAILSIPNNDPDENPFTISLFGIGTLSFKDVNSNHWAYLFIEALHNAKITNGCGKGNYCPDQKVTRAQIAIFLGKAMYGANYKPAKALGIYQDVPADYWAADWIELLTNDCITTGCDTNSYCPEEKVTRAQAAVLLMKAKNGSEYTPPKAKGIYKDIPTDHWAADWIELITQRGISRGCGVNKYCPDLPITRDQMAVLLVKVFDLPTP